MNILWRKICARMRSRDGKRQWIEARYEPERQEAGFIPREWERRN